VKASPKPAARAGLGIAFLALTPVDRDLIEGRLMRALPEYRQDPGGVFAVTPTRRQRSLAMARWIDFAAERLTGSPERLTRNQGMHKNTTPA
jgi:DNA-binding transcriptional LysR family regulator